MRQKIVNFLILTPFRYSKYYNMKDKYKIWLILEKSDETRVSSSIESYRDRTGKIYNYDSLVPNYKNLGLGDFIIIRKENDILGLGRISVIKSSDSVKTHKRCPHCSTTDIRTRKNKKPKWKCGQCKTEFTTPIESEINVTKYTADIIDFNKFDLAPSVTQVKSCALNGDGLKSQISIMELDLRRIMTLLSIDLSDFKDNEKQLSFGQGINLTYKERKAIEIRAMDVVNDLYTRDGWTLLDTSNSRPYDFKGKKGKEIRFIEVKGTTGDGASVILTHGEVNHVSKNPKTSALVVVSKINLDRSNENPIASGGEISTHMDPWFIDNDQLTSTQFKYLLNNKT